MPQRKTSAFYVYRAEPQSRRPALFCNSEASEKFLDNQGDAEYTIANLIISQTNHECQTANNQTRMEVEPDEKQRRAGG